MGNQKLNFDPVIIHLKKIKNKMYLGAWIILCNNENIKSESSIGFDKKSFNYLMELLVVGNFYNPSHLWF